MSPTLIALMVALAVIYGGLRLFIKRMDDIDKIDRE